MAIFKVLSSDEGPRAAGGSSSMNESMSRPSIKPTWRKWNDPAPASPDDPTSKIFSNYAASLPSQSCVVEQSHVTVMCSFRKFLDEPIAILTVSVHLFRS